MTLATLLLAALNISFARGQWNPDDFTRVKCARHDYIGAFDQREDCIVNHCPEGATPEEVFKRHNGTVYAAMVHRRKFAIGTTISSTMAWDWRMAPLIVIARDLGKAKTGENELREHWEVVVYDEGINIWHHFYKDGKQSWFKAAALKLPEAAKFKANVKHTLSVKVAKDKRGNKCITASCDGYDLHCIDNTLPDEFLAGIIGCEGRNFFYDFSAVAEAGAWERNSEGVLLPPHRKGDWHAGWIWTGPAVGTPTFRKTFVCHPDELKLVALQWVCDDRSEAIVNGKSAGVVTSWACPKVNDKILPLLKDGENELVFVSRNRGSSGGFMGELDLVKKSGEVIKIGSGEDWQGKVKDGDPWGKVREFMRLPQPPYGETPYVDYEAGGIVRGEVTEEPPVFTGVAPKLVAEVRQVGGAVHYFENGVEKPFIPYRTPSAGVWRGGHLQFLKSMDAASIRIAEVSLPLTRKYWKSDGTLDTVAFERELHRALAYAPHMNFILFFNTDAPEWYVKAHPEDCYQYAEGDTMPYISYASLDYRAAVVAFLEKTAAWLKTRPYYGRVVGFGIDGGYDGQLLQWPGFGYKRMGDYSAPMRKLFGREIPSADRRRGSREKLMLDPVKDRDIIEFNHLYSQTPADFLLATAGALKRATDREKLVGAYYGKFFSIAGYLECGEFDIGRILRSDDLDFLIAVEYNQRVHGRPHSLSAPTESYAMHRKLFIDEADIRTFLDGQKEYGYAGDEKGTESMMRKMFVLPFTRGHAMHWYDLFGGWFEHPKIQQTITSLQQLAARHCHRGVRPAEIALVVDEESLVRSTTSIKEVTARNLLHYQNGAFGRIGAPFDVYFADDLAAAPKYKMYVFIDCYAPTEAAAKAIAAVKASGATCVTVNPGDKIPSSREYRELARQAGVTLYSKVDDVMVYVGRGLLGVHSAKAGRKTLYWPRPATFKDAFTGKVVGKMTEEFYVDFEAGETKIFEVEEPDWRVDVETENQFHTIILPRREATLKLTNESDEPKAFSGKVTFTDYFGEAFSLPVKGSAEPRQSVSIRVPADKLTRKGIWRVSSDFSQSSAAFAVLDSHPVTARIPRGQAFRFGVNYHVQRFTAPDWDIQFPIMESLGVKLVRTGVFNMAHCAPKTPTPDWSRSDEIMRRMKASGISLDANVFNTPDWAIDPKWKNLRWSVRSRKRPVPGTLGEYARQLSSRYGTDIDYYEVGNEWDLFSTEMMTVDEMVDVHKEAYNGLKKGNPNVCVMLNGFAVGDSSHNQVAQKGIQEGMLEKLRGFYDIHPTHLHGAFGHYRGMLEEKFLPMRKRLGVTVPWFANETAQTTAFGLEDEAAATVWKKFLHAWANGSVDMVWYNLIATGRNAIDQEQAYGLYTHDYHPRATAAAFAAATTVFGDVDFDRTLHADVTRLVYRFRRGRKLVIAGWDAAARTSHAIGVKTDAKRVKAVDLMGNEVECAVVGGRVTYRLAALPTALVFEDATAAEADAQTLATPCPRQVTAIEVPNLPMNRRAPDLRLDSVSQVHELWAANPATVHRCWKGPSDFSADVWLTRKADKVVAVAKVLDEKLAKGDRVEFGYSPTGGKPVKTTVTKCERHGGLNVFRAEFPYAPTFKFRVRLYDDDGEGDDGWLDSSTVEVTLRD